MKNILKLLISIKSIICIFVIISSITVITTTVSAAVPKDTKKEKDSKKYYTRDDKINILDNVHFYLGFSVGSDNYKIDGTFRYNFEVINNSKLKSYSSDALLPIANAFVPIIGIKFIDYFSVGVECGFYGFYQPIRITGAQTERLRIKNLFLDFMGYIPLLTNGTFNRFEIVAGLGAGHMRMKEDGTLGAMVGGDNYSKYGVRAKLGALYNVNNNWGIRGLVGYQKVGHLADKYAIDNVRSINLDLLYLF